MNTVPVDEWMKRKADEPHPVLHPSGRVIDVRDDVIFGFYDKWAKGNEKPPSSDEVIYIISGHGGGNGQEYIKIPETPKLKFGVTGPRDNECVYAWNGPGENDYCFNSQEHMFGILTGEVVVRRKFARFMAELGSRRNTGALIIPDMIFQESGELDDKAISRDFSMILKKAGDNIIGYKLSQSVVNKKLTRLDEGKNSKQERDKAIEHDFSLGKIKNGGLNELDRRIAATDISIAEQQMLLNNNTCDPNLPRVRNTLFQKIKDSLTVYKKQLLEKAGKPSETALKIISGCPNARGILPIKNMPKLGNISILGSAETNLANMKDFITRICNNVRQSPLKILTTSEKDKITGFITLKQLLPLILKDAKDNHSGKTVTIIINSCLVNMENNGWLPIPDPNYKKFLQDNIRRRRTPSKVNSQARSRENRIKRTQNSRLLARQRKQTKNRILSTIPEGGGKRRKRRITHRRKRKI